MQFGCADNVQLNLQVPLRCDHIPQDFQHLSTPNGVIPKSPSGHGIGSMLCKWLVGVTLLVLQYCAQNCLSGTLPIPTEALPMQQTRLGYSVISGSFTEMIAPNLSMETPAACQCDASSKTLIHIPCTNSVGPEYMQKRKKGCRRIGPAGAAQVAHTWLHTCMQCNKLCCDKLKEKSLHFLGG